MKKIKIILPLVAVLCFFTACTSEQNGKNDTTAVETQTQSTSNAVENTAPTAKAVAGIDELSTQKVVWGPGNITEHKQPTDPVQLQKRFEGLNATWLLKDEKSVCLTFDEGYENGYTPQILDTLKEKNARAIFFVTYDFAKDNPDLIRRMIDEGHIVGNHSYRHYTMDEVSEEVARQEVTYIHDYMEKEYGYTMCYFRFPKGEFSEQSLGIVNSLGYNSVFWSFAYADWDPEKQPDETEAFRKICESTHPGEILLLHAVSKTNADILGKVIDDIRQQGYTLTVDI